MSLSRDLLLRPIAFQPIYVDITGSVTAALFLSQCCYWSKITSNTKGWFYKTNDEWREETKLSRHMIESSRKTLNKLGVLEEKRVGVPAKLHYRVNHVLLDNLINMLLKSKEKSCANVVQNEIKEGKSAQKKYIKNNNMPISGNLDFEKLENQTSNFRQSNTETTTEITTEITKDLLCTSDELHDKFPDSKNLKIEKKKNRETRKTLETRFEEFWMFYPSGRKKNKARAMKRWMLLKPSKGESIDFMIDNILFKLGKQIKYDRQWQDTRFIPLPDTYLNNQRWEDEIEPIVQSSRSFESQLREAQQEISEKIINQQQTNQFEGIDYAPF